MGRQTRRRLRISKDRWIVDFEWLYNPPGSLSINIDDRFDRKEFAHLGIEEVSVLVEWLKIESLVPLVERAREAETLLLEAEKYILPSDDEHDLLGRIHAIAKRHAPKS